MTAALPESHPFADLLPLIHGAEFEALALDISTHGLHQPITLFDHQVLDGRNRLRACEAAGVVPRFENFTGTEDEALALVLSLNVSRRHLTTPQRAVLALKLLPLEEDAARRRQGARTDLHQNPDGGEPGQALDRAGRRVGVSRDTVWKVRRIAEHAPDVIDAMTEGLVKSIPEAERLAQIQMSLRPAVVEHLRATGGRVSAALRAVRVDGQTQRVEQTPTSITLERPGVRLLYGRHVIDALRGLDAASVHTVVTSPPYFGALRDYGAAPVVWGGNDHGCDHRWGSGPPDHRGRFGQTKQPLSVAAGTRKNGTTGAFCSACRAWRGHLGHEPTVGLYVEHLVGVFDEIRRVLRPDGTAWLVLGDCYVGTRQGHDGLKPKDLVMVPHRVAIALQEKGWWVRQDICWEKPNALPDPVTDRPTRSHEFVFLLGHPDGGGHYFYDADAVREPFADPTPAPDARVRQSGAGGRADGHTQPHGIDPRPHAGRNRRSVWSLATQPYPAAHFATFPPWLVEPMILAGTSSAGACNRCGTPWSSSDAERGEPAPGGGKPRQPADGAATSSNGRSGRQARGEARGTTADKAVEVPAADWRPSCDCGVDEVVPCVVLDPFSGTATTGRVALDHGRTYIGIDLNIDYLSLAKNRLGI